MSWNAYFRDEDGRELWDEVWLFKRAHGIGETFIRNFQGFVVSDVQIGRRLEEIHYRVRICHEPWWHELNNGRVSGHVCQDHHLFRWHRGGLADSMAELFPVRTRFDLAFTINSCARLGVPILVADDLEISKYGDIDARIGWDTFIVKARDVELPLGFLSGELCR